MTEAPSELDIEAALQHPKSFFAEPKDVVAHPTLPRDVKLKILREWEQDARRLSASEGEGFCGGEDSMLGRVEDAITLVQKQS
jgi:hypothetical protein